MRFQKILIIQTAFIGDVILATPLIEKWHRYYPEGKIDFLLRKGNEALLKGHPLVEKVHVWNKKEGKIRGIFQIIRALRKERYDLLINLQRFGATGFMTWWSGAGLKVGFDKNPFAFSYHRKFHHQIGNGKHEVRRNLELIEEWTDDTFERPRLHLDESLMASVAAWKKTDFATLAPTSVWFTKQFPAHKWVELIQKLSFDGKIYLLGAPNDYEACESIRTSARDNRVENLCGALNLLQSAALMKDAKMNYVNDSAPMHLASAVNAPVRAIFCSTIPDFGFGPLSDDGKVVELEDTLPCRPCGLHGYKACPKGHFHCAEKISIDRILQA
jgi:heptosyltransferase-2